MWRRGLIGEALGDARCGHVPRGRGDACRAVSDPLPLTGWNYPQKTLGFSRKKGTWEPLSLATGLQLGKLRPREAEGWSQGAAEAGSEGASSSRKLSLRPLLLFLPVRILLPPANPSPNHLRGAFWMSRYLWSNPPTPRRVSGSQNEMQMRLKELASPKAAFTRKLPCTTQTSLRRPCPASRMGKPALLT